jgi:hypothetical protein
MTINILRRIVLKTDEQPLINLTALFICKTYNTIALSKEDKISLSHKAIMEATQ